MKPILDNLPAAEAGSPRSAVVVRGVSKRYGATRALVGVNVEVRPGTVHALIGENGAGKSTMVKILAGAVRPDAGEIMIGGRTIALRSPAQARQAGIAAVHQELSLFPALSVVSNIYAGHEQKNSIGLVHFEAMRDAVRITLDDIGWALPLDRAVGTLSLAEQQMVEIVRAIHFKARLVLLDEPNSALTDTESAALFDVLRRLRERGQAFVLVSHRLDEVLSIADEVSILRDGQMVHSSAASKLTIRDCVKFMVGNEDSLVVRPSRVPLPTSPVRLQISSLASGDLKELSLTIRAGEVVGVAGLEGSGVQPLFESLFGIRRLERGEIRLNNRNFAPRGPADAISAGVASIPADRRTEGLLGDRSVTDNIVLVVLKRLQSLLGFLNEERLRAAGDEFAERFHIKAPSAGASVMTLSGGNQQKVVLAKWLATKPRVLLLNDPTRGIDVGTKAEVHRVVRELAAEGVSVLVWSSDNEELLTLCDRLVVLRRGRMMQEFLAAETSRRDLVLAVAGGLEG